MRKLAVCFIALCTAPRLAPADDQAAAFTFTTIDPPGSTFTFPFGINPEGDIVGNYVAGGHNHGFLLHDGTYTTIDFPGATATLARRIDPQGWAFTSSAASSM